MDSFRVSLHSVAILIFVATLKGQSQDSTWISKLLPSDATIIDAEDVSAQGTVTRRLVLWMLHPKRVAHPKEEDNSCSDSLYGDHWYGPARLSLLDLSTKKIINTIQIHGKYAGSDDPERGFPIPFLVRSGGPYYVPRQGERTRETDSKQERFVKILSLRDLTGEGIPGQFVLFEYEACAISLTTALGYSPHTDRAVQYEVETLLSSGARDLTTWVEEVFGYPPSAPGHWEFTWEPGHGADVSIQERVSFDRMRQLFVRKLMTNPTSH